MDISTLATEGYVKVGYPDSLRGAVTEAMQSWQNFCSLAEADKLQFSINDRNHDYGYMLRNEGAARSDSKEMFHVLKAEVPELLQIAEKVVDERAVGFIKAVDELIGEITPLISDFATAVEEEYQVPGLAKDVMEYKDHWIFRYLHYFGGSTMLAKAHPDRGGFTLHLDESHPGGEYLDQDKQWQAWPVSHDETIIFPDMNLQHRSENKLKALWHRVQPTEVSAETGRFAMVAFINFKHTHQIKAEHERLADFPEGFNLTIPFAEFDDLFEPIG